MSVKLRLTRVGKKKKPFYRIVAADSRSPRDGRFIEVVASYSPNRDPEVMGLDEERVCYWLDNGAVMSERVRGILEKEGVLARWEKAKNPEMEAEAPASESAEEAVAEETPISEGAEEAPEEVEAISEEAVAEEVLSVPEEPVEKEVAVPEKVEEAVAEEVASVPEEPVEKEVKASKPVKSKPKKAAPKKKTAATKKKTE